MKASLRRTPRIALFMDSSRAYEQGLIRGILKYSLLHGPWQFFRIMPVVSGGSHANLADLKAWHADGIIWREKEGAANLLSLGIPTVISPYRSQFADYPNVLTNDAAIGIMAAEHFLDRGHRNFAFYGITDRYWSSARQASFSARLKKAGFCASAYIDAPHRSQAIRQSRLAGWLATLPKPLGLMVCTDDCSYDCVEACRLAGLGIPEDVAIIGVGNDELVCNFSYPPLSSVVLNTEQAGYEAAEMLATMIRNPKRAVRNVIAEPLHVVTRQSTDLVATEDRNFAMAIRYIRDNAGHNLGVEDVVRAVPVSRRALYQKFHDILGRSIHGEIRRVQMNYAAKMLIETDLPVTEIATRLGYPDAKNLSRVFRCEKELTPLSYRNRNR